MVALAMTVEDTPEPDAFNCRFCQDKGWIPIGDQSGKQDCPDCDLDPMGAAAPNPPEPAVAQGGGVPDPEPPVADSIGDEGAPSPPPKAPPEPAPPAAPGPGPLVADSVTRPDGLPDARPGAAVWRWRDWETAMPLAQATGRRVLLVVSPDWYACGPCESLKRELAELLGVTDTALALMGLPSIAQSGWVGVQRSVDREWQAARVQRHRRRHPEQSEREVAEATGFPLVVVCDPGDEAIDGVFHPVVLWSAVGPTTDDILEAMKD